MTVSILKKFYASGVYSKEDLYLFFRCGKITKDDLENILAVDKTENENIIDSEEEVEF